MSERYEGPVPPGHGEQPAPDRERPAPFCPVCGAMMRRYSTQAPRSPLVCDLHGFQDDPVWQPIGDDAA